MPKKKKTTAPEPGPIVPIWGVSEFERSKFIVQLRCEIANDHAKVYRRAATSNLTNMLRNEQREMLHAIAEGYELQSSILQNTLDLADGKLGPKTTTMLRWP